VRLRRVLLDRPRELAAFDALDFVVHGVVAELLTEAMAPVLSPRLYSYRRGVSPWRVARAFAEVVRRHRAERPDPRTRGLYVLRADVRRYIESLPVDARSPLWADLSALTGLSPGEPSWTVLEAVVRPEIAGEAGALSMFRRGLPMGSPAANTLLNLYLGPLDEALERLGGAFQARFCDDVLFADPDPERVRRAVDEAAAAVRARGLELHPDKLRVYYFNGAARRSPAWPEAEPTREVRFLGCGVRWDGTLVLPRDKWRVLLRELRGRVRGAARLLEGASLEERGPALCQVVAASLDPGSPLAHRYAQIVYRLISDRRQLAELDFLLARMIAQALTRDPTARAFRAVPPRRLRAWGLPSLVARRNG
jgi:hypothetical protein